MADQNDELNMIQYTPYSNFQIKLPSKNPYSNCNFNQWQRSIQYNISNPYPYLGDGNNKLAVTYETILDQPGFYPPSMDIICDQIKVLI